MFMWSLLMVQATVFPKKKQRKTRTNLKKRKKHHQAKVIITTNFSIQVVTDSYELLLSLNETRFTHLLSPHKSRNCFIFSILTSPIWLVRSFSFDEWSSYSGNFSFSFRVHKQSKVLHVGKKTVERWQLHEIVRATQMEGKSFYYGKHFSFNAFALFVLSPSLHNVFGVELAPFYTRFRAIFLLLMFNSVVLKSFKWGKWVSFILENLYNGWESGPCHVLIMLDEV